MPDINSPEFLPGDVDSQEFLVPVTIVANLIVYRKDEGSAMGRAADLVHQFLRQYSDYADETTSVNVSKPIEFKGGVLTTKERLDSNQAFRFES